MIGTGVFTSVGFLQVVCSAEYLEHLIAVARGRRDGTVWRLLRMPSWARIFKESGGDYIYLSRVFHPVLGYLSAWAGLTVGFSAPVALAAMAFTKYLAPFGLQNNVGLAIGVIVLIGLMHSFTIKHSSRFQNISTIVKVLFIVCLILIGFLIPDNGSNAIDLSKGWLHEIWKPGFAVSMVYVSFAYTGWNAAAYVVAEIDNPKKKKSATRADRQHVICCDRLYSFSICVVEEWLCIPITGPRRSDVHIFLPTCWAALNAGGKWVSIFIMRYS